MKNATNTSKKTKNASKEKPANGSPSQLIDGRIKELKETWEIASLREDVIGPDGLFHKQVARYVLIGKRKDLPPAQQSLDLEGA